MASKQRTPLARIASNTKHKLIDAAHTLIWANSYAHVSVDDICRAAGVQKGSFYHFFPTKSDLAVAALEDKWQASRTLLDALFVTHTDPRDQLKAICHTIYTKQKEALTTTGMVCGCPYATLASEMRGDNQTLRQLSEKMSESFRGYYEKLLKNAVRAGLIEKTGIDRMAREMHVHTMGAMLEARLSDSLKAVGADLHAALLRMSRMDTAPQKKRTKR
jgi:TetR/AcrR family transcriptional regulator, transcriptional repressor for nem operon